MEFEVGGKEIGNREREESEGGHMKLVTKYKTSGILMNSRVECFVEIISNALMKTNDAN